VRRLINRANGMGLCYCITAKNSSQNMRLFVDKQKDEEITLTLTGEHDGKEIQIDFDSLSVIDANDLADFIKARANGGITV